MNSTTNIGDISLRPTTSKECKKLAKLLYTQRKELEAQQLAERLEKEKHYLSVQKRVHERTANFAERNWYRMETKRRNKASST